MPCFAYVVSAIAIGLLALVFWPLAVAFFLFIVVLAVLEKKGVKA